MDYTWSSNVRPEPGRPPPYLTTAARSLSSATSSPHPVDHLDVHRCLSSLSTTISPTTLSRRRPARSSSQSSLKTHNLIAAPLTLTATNPPPHNPPTNRKNALHTQLVTWKHIAHGSVYDSLRHFLDGESVYLPPRNLTELREVLYVPPLSLSPSCSPLTPPPGSVERCPICSPTSVNFAADSAAQNSALYVFYPRCASHSPPLYSPQMKQIAYGSLRAIVDTNANDFLQLYSNKADWHAKPPRALRQAGTTLT
jgi:hypothetical protein